MSYLGSWKVGDTITVPLQCSQFSTGAAYDATGDPTYRVYENNTGTPVATGTFAKLDDDNTVGFYQAQLELGTWATKGASYTIRKAATVDSVSAATEDTFQIEAEVDSQSISSTGTSLSAIPWNAAWDAEVESECQDALVADNLDHLAGTATGIPAIPAGTYLDQIMDDGTATYDRTTDSLQAIRDASATVSNLLAFQKNTQFANFSFALYSSTDHRTPATGKAAVITCERSIDGGAFAACTNTATEIGSTGVYKITLSADDMNGNVIMLRFSDSQTIDTFDPRLFEIFTPTTA